MSLLLPLTRINKGKYQLVNGIRYRIFDDFGDNRPKNIIEVDTENKLVVADGKLTPLGGKTSPAYNDPAIYYRIGRELGNIVIFSVDVNNTTTRSTIGFSTIFPGTAQNTCIFLINAEIRIDSGIGFTFAVVGTLTIATHKFAAIQRAVGGFYFQWQSAKPILIGIDDFENAGDSVCIGNYNATYSYDYIKVPIKKWYPKPVVSDGFSAVTTDGLGHSENDLNGSGLSWVDSLGTWVNSSGKSNASTLSGGFAFRTVDCGKSNYIIHVDLTHVLGNAGLLLRYVDPSNYIYVYHSGTQVSLRKVVGGSETTVLSLTNSTYVADRKLRIHINATKLRVFYNSLAVGSELTISDVGLQSSTLVGLFTTNVGNLFNNFCVYALGTDNEYSILDTF